MMLLLVASSAWAQEGWVHVKKQEYGSLVWMQFVTPNLFVGVTGDLSGGGESASASFQNYLTNVKFSFPFVDTSYWEGRVENRVRECYSAKGIRFTDSLHGAIFGRYHYYHFNYIYTSQDDTNGWISFTTDAGVTWNSNTSTSLVSEVQLSPVWSQGDWVYLNGRDALCRYNVQSNSFNIVRKFKSFPLVCFGIDCGAMRDSLNGLIAIKDTSSINHLLKTTNGGTSWTDIRDTSESPSFIRNDSVGRYWMKTEKGVFVSTDDGTTWSQRFRASDSVVDIAFGSTSVTYGTTAANDHILKSRDSGFTWFSIPLVHVKSSCVAALDSNNVFVFIASVQDHYRGWPYEYWKTSTGGSGTSVVLKFRDQILSNFELWPNPSTGSFNIKTDEPLSLRIFDALGREQLLTETMPNETRSVSLPTGLYRVVGMDRNRLSYSANIIVR